MNKKTYLAPETIMVNLKTVRMIAASETGTVVRPGSASGRDALSRQSGGWDDED